MLAIPIVVFFNIFVLSSGISNFVVDRKIKCANNGVGYSNGATFFCKCKPNTTGKQCQIIISTTTQCPPTCNPCINNPCMSRGICSNVNCNAVCQCFQGFYGQNCQFYQAVTTTCQTVTTSYNPCAISPCQNGGICYNNNGYAACACINGFTGTYCSSTTTRTTTATTTLPTTTIPTTTTPIPITTTSVIPTVPTTIIPVTTIPIILPTTTIIR